MFTAGSPGHDSPCDILGCRRDSCARRQPPALRKPSLMDPAAHQLMREHAAAQHDHDTTRTGTWCTARIPFNGGDLDGAIVELHLHPDDGIFTGEVRIPGPPAP